MKALSPEYRLHRAFYPELYGDDPYPLEQYWPYYSPQLDKNCGVVVGDRVSTDGKEYILGAISKDYRVLLLLNKE